MNDVEKQRMAEHFAVPGPMDRIRQKRKGERAYTNDEIARFESLRAELRAFDDPAQIDRMEKAVSVLRGNAK